MLKFRRFGESAVDGVRRGDFSRRSFETIFDSPLLMGVRCEILRATSQRIMLDGLLGVSRFARGWTLFKPVALLCYRSEFGLRFC